jgi:hypothetical protein
MRPWRLAGPASGTTTHFSVTASRTSTASPTAQMCGSFVCSRSLTRMPPSPPISNPALRASSMFGRTPSPRITVSAGKRRPLFSTTTEARAVSPSRGSSNPDTGFLRCNSTSLAFSSRCSQDAISGSRGAMTWPFASTRLTDNPPRRTSCSAISKPNWPVLRRLLLRPRRRQ